MLRILIRNIVSNWVGYAVNAVVIFFLTPFVLRSLGDTRYGVWVLATGLTGYYGLLDLGLRGGTIQYLTRYLARRDYAAMNRTASTSVAALAVCGLVVSFASLAISCVAPLIFTIPEDAISEVRWCIAILGITTAIQFTFAVYSAVFVATQRYDLANAIAIPIRLTSAAGTCISLKLGYGLLGLCVVNAMCDMLACIGRAAVAHRILPELRVSLRLAAWRDFRPILSYGIVNSLIQGATTLKNYSSALIIGLFMPLAALAPFNLAAGMMLQIDHLFGTMSVVFFPLATQLDAEGEREKLRRMYFAVSRIFLCVAVTVGMIGAIWADEFYRLWVGPTFVDGREYTSVVLLFWILMLAEIVRIGQKIGHQILLGCRAMGTLTYLTLVEAGATVVLMIPMVLFFDLLGIVLATLIPVLIVVGVLFPIAVCRLIQANVTQYFLAAYRRPILVALFLAPPLLFLRVALPVRGHWMLLVLSGVLAAILAGPILLFVGLNGEERRQLLFKPLWRIGVWRYSRNATDAVA